MLILGSQLNQTPILSLQTGTRLAVTKKPVIDPNDLKIIAYEIDGINIGTKPAFTMISDVRELNNIGMIIDSDDEFVGLEDVVFLKKLWNLNFNIIGLPVFTEERHKLGKINDYSIDTDSFIIQQINVMPGIFKSLNQTSLLINRSQIIEINDSAIIVKSTRRKIKTPATNKEQLHYVNPFRSPNVASSDSSSSLTSS